MHYLPITPKIKVKGHIRSGNFLSYTGMVKDNSSVLKNFSKAQETGGGPAVSGAQDKEFSKNKNGTAKSLRKSEKLFYVLFNQAADAVFLLDPRQADNPLIVDANMAACKMHGYAYEELVGKPISMVYKNLDKKQVQDRTRHLLEGEHLVFEVEHAKKDGLVFPVEVSARIVDIQGRPFIQAVDRDISERKQAEEKIRRNYEMQTVLNKIIKLSMEDVSLDEMLDKSLVLILSMPWLSIESKGSIYVANNEKGVLERSTQRRLSKAVLEKCKIIPFGQCNCGRAAAERKVVFTRKIDDCHKQLYGKIKPHGHYCIPLLAVKGMVLGVLNLYLKEGQEFIREEAEFLKSIANTLAIMIQRKIIEKQVLDSREKFRNLAEQSPNMIFINSRGKLVYANKKFEEILGYKLAELSADDFDFMQLVSKESKYKVLEAFKSYNEEKEVSPYECVLVAKSGEKISVLNTTKLIRYENRLAILGTVTDITERKKAEEKIIQAKNDWQDTFDNISDMITIHDKDFNIIRANKAAKKILKLPLLTEMKSKCYRCFHGTDSPSKSCPSCDCLKSGKPVSFEMFEPHLEKFIEIRAMPRFDADKKIIGVIHVVRDISRRKKNEEELRIAREGLEQKVAERTKELNKINKKLEERIKAHKSAEDTLVDSYKYLGIANRRMSIVLDLKNKVKDKTQSEVIESVVDVATEFSNASVCILFAYEAKDHAFYLLSANGIENKKGLQRKIFLRDNSLLRDLVSQKKAINVISRDIKRGDLRQMNIEKNLNQLIMFPIFSEGNIKYCVLFGFKDENDFSVQDTSFYEAFMKQAALALHDTEGYHA